MDSGERNVEIRIRFAKLARAAELEVLAPTREQVAFRLWQALDHLRIRPLAPVLVHAGERLIVRAKLTDLDGSPLTQRRASQVLERLRSALALRPPASRRAPASSRRGSSASAR